MGYFVFVWASTLGLILASAGVAKLADPQASALLQQYGFRSDSTARLASLLQIGGEIALGAILLAGWGDAVGLITGGAVFLMFGVSMSRTLGRSDSPVPCGCLGKVLNIRAQRSSVVANSSIALITFFVSRFKRADLAPMGGETVALWSMAILLAIVYWLAAYAWTVSSRIEDQIMKKVEA